jgi:hypothetical protein
MDLEGGCACGSVRYRLTAPPLIVHACHCRDCLVRIGTLDHPERVEPDVHIFTRAKLPWFRLPPDKLAFEAFLQDPGGLAGRQSGAAAQQHSRPELIVAR